MKDTKRYILCSAIWYRHNTEVAHQPVNVSRGFVLCGWRHCSIIAQYATLVPHKDRVKGPLKQIQGFLTNENWFVTREEAAIIAKDAGQLKGGKQIATTLTSEDLW